MYPSHFQVSELTCVGVDCPPFNTVMVILLPNGNLKRTLHCRLEQVLYATRMCVNLSISTTAAEVPFVEFLVVSHSVSRQVTQEAVFVAWSLPE